MTLLMCSVSDFCDNYSLDSHHMKTAKPAAKVRRRMSNLMQQKPMVDQSEEAQLRAAIQASLEDNVVEIVDSEGDSTPPKLLELPPEPLASDPNSTRIQLRVPDGKRIVRRVLKSDPVRVLFNVVRHQVPEAVTKAFQLRTTFPPKAIEESDQTFEEQGLLNEAIVMQWSEPL